MKSLFKSPVILLLLLAVMQYGCNTSSAVSGSSPGQDIPYTTLLERLRREPQLNISGSEYNPMITIRGIKSIEGSSEPLFVVDGTPLGYGYSSVQSVDVNQVKSVRVLPPSQAGIYGSRGGNGVVQITTK